MAGPVQSSEAIILHLVNYGEADRIVTFLTPGYGRLKGFARSARKSRKRFGAALEPFSRVRLFWQEGRGGDLVSLQEAELIDLHAGLRSDLAAMALAGYGCELVRELSAEHQGQEELYRLLEAFLGHLAAEGGTREARLLFELRLLAQAGYVPHLLHCSLCGASFVDDTVGFDAASGGSLCLSCDPAGRGLRVGRLTLGTLSRCLHGEATRFAGVRLSPRTLAEGEAMLADALQQHLHRPLKSRSFLEQMMAL